MIQVAILFVLMFVIMLGIGFILNMLLKTTWLPLYAYGMLIVGILIWFVVKEDGTFWETIQSFDIPDYLTAVGGFLGAWLSGSTINALRVNGFKMF
jgi:amino acid transporter